MVDGGADKASGARTHINDCVGENPAQNGKTKSGNALRPRARISHTNVSSLFSFKATKTHLHLHHTNYVLPASTKTSSFSRFSVGKSVEFSFLLEASLVQLILCS